MKGLRGMAAGLVALGATSVAMGQGTAPPVAGTPKEETRITKAQAKELFQSVDEILSFVSTDTKLPIAPPGEADDRPRGSR